MHIRIIKIKCLSRFSILKKESVTLGFEVNTANSSEGMNYYMNITTTALSHLGLVFGTFDEFGIADLIDTIIPKNRNHNKSHYAVIKAMCLNGLGFNES